MTGAVCGAEIDMGLHGCALDVGHVGRHRCSLDCGVTWPRLLEAPRTEEDPAVLAWRDGVERSVKGNPQNLVYPVPDEVRDAMREGWRDVFAQQMDTQMDAWPPTVQQVVGPWYWRWAYRLEALHVRLTGWRERFAGCGLPRRDNDDG